MSSHCFMQIDKLLEPKDLEQDLKDIIHRKFHDLLKVECHHTNEIYDWDIRFDATHGFPVCLKTKKIEFMHPDDAWSYWAQSVIEDELAIKYNAKMLDDEYPKQQFQPLPECHATFEKYLETTMHHSEQWKKAIIAIELSRLPIELKKI